MAAIGWITLEEAETYFETRYNSTAWDSAASSQTAALQTAYNQLIDCGRFSTPTTPDTPGKMKRAQCEQALFIIQHQEDADSRMGLQAQGVTSAGIVQESYEIIGGIPVSPYAVKALSAWDRERVGFFQVDAERDDDA